VVLNYRQKDNGMYILRRGDMETIATAVLNEHMPHLLAGENVVPIEHLAQECYGLDIESRNITVDKRILGMMAFGNIEVPMYDLLMNPIRERVLEGTMLIDECLLAKENTARRRFTIAHELSHWILHRPYRSSNRYIACRTENVGKFTFKENMTDDDYGEWQANVLAAAILMPQVTMPWAVSNAFSAMGIEWNDTYMSDHKRRSITTHIAEIFKVSLQAAEIRLEQLGYFKKKKILRLPY